MCKLQCKYSCVHTHQHGNVKALHNKTLKHAKQLHNPVCVVHTWIHSMSYSVSVNVRMTHGLCYHTGISWPNSWSAAMQNQTTFSRSPGVSVRSFRNVITGLRLLRHSTPTQFLSFSLFVIKPHFGAKAQIKLAVFQCLLENLEFQVAD